MVGQNIAANVEGVAAVGAFEKPQLHLLHVVVD
jgi:hypothetical protein